VLKSLLKDLLGRFRDKTKIYKDDDQVCSMQPPQAGLSDGSIN
jgi:hypothetical protein